MNQKQTLSSIHRSLSIIIDLITGLKKFIIFFAALYIGFIILLFMTADMFQETGVENPFLLFELSILNYLFLFLYVCSFVILYYLLDQGSKLIKDILAYQIFDTRVITRMQVIFRYLIAYYMILAISTLSFQFAVIALIVVMGIVKQIFVYGNELEKEMSEVI